VSGALFAEETVFFQNFPWGTSLNEFTAKMGKPVHQEEYNGLSSLVYENVMVSGYTTYMLVYFSKNGLEGGTYYFLTNSLEELQKCYKDMQKELFGKYGQTDNYDNGIMREMRQYGTIWKLDSGYVFLKVNTRLNEPVTLLYSSPALSKMLFGS